MHGDGRFQRFFEERVLERFLECGDPHHGFARIYCAGCRYHFVLPFSCKARYFCPSCHQKRVLSYGEWVEQNVLVPVAHRQYVFTVPKLLRPIFSRRRALLGKLCRIAKELLIEAYRAAVPEGVPGLILFVQTFGDLVNFNPHIHVLAADGVFLDSGAFVPLPAVPVKLLMAGLRTRVLDLLEREGEVSEKLRSAMMAWRHSGFSVHNAVRVRANDAEGRKMLARYMLRAPFSLEKMHYDERRGTVIYRSHMHKGLKRNFQVMPGVEWLELLCRHIPDRFKHLVRYAGWYSNRSRARHRQQGEQLPDADPRDEELACARAKSSWARLIHKVYEVDPLVCPKCKGPMRVIALIEDADVIKRILTHLGCWNPRPAWRERAPPVTASGSLESHLPYLL